jgi:hypothetical protein
MKRWISTSGLWLAAAGIALLACTDASEGTIDPATAPSGPAFKPVALVLVDRCGSLDCHGSKYRNMRLYGFGTARLDPTNRPDAPETTDSEADLDYESIVSLEPDILRRVVAEGGREPERLTFMRKARGIESHKGGQPIADGDTAYDCLTSWLRSAVDANTCRSSVPRLAAP